MRATLVTREEIEGAKRKLAWFAKTSRGLYFEVGGFFRGSHTSYHVDGNVFRTNPATQGQPRFQGTYLPLEEFRGGGLAGDCPGDGRPEEYCSPVSGAIPKPWCGSSSLSPRTLTLVRHLTTALSIPDASALDRLRAPFHLFSPSTAVQILTSNPHFSLA